MRRTRSQPGRARGGGEREEILQEPGQGKEEPHRGDSLRRDRPSSDMVANLAANCAAWVAWVKQWVEKQEPRRVAVRDYLLQLRARVESKVKQHWPLARAWLILITRVMLMLSLLGLEAAIRGFASLFRLGSAAHFLLLWCTVISFIRLAGLFNLVIALVTHSWLSNSFSLSFVTFHFVLFNEVPVTHRVSELTECMCELN